MNKENKRTYEANAAVTLDLRLEAETVKQQPTAPQPENPRRRTPGFTPELVLRVIERMRDL